LTRNIIYFLFFAISAVAALYGREARCAGEISAGKGSPASSTLAKAQSEFAKGSWETAIPLYKKHLKTSPTDFPSWSQLSAAYYHSGQIPLALSTLKKISGSAPDRSFNFFYQGMCLAVSGSETEAYKYWQYAANWPDEFGARALFEMAASAYRSDDSQRSRQLFLTYLQRFPRGPDAQGAKDTLKAMDEGRKIDPLKSFDRPDRELAMYKYHRWSLFNIPHFWQIEVGGTSTEGNGYEPNSNGNLGKKADSNAGLTVNASFGFGPTRQNHSTSFAGYTYKQNWITETNSIQNWVGNGFSMDNFPLRGDFLERTHQLFGDFRHQFNSNIFIGAYARIEFSRVGSSFFPSADSSSLKVVTSEKDTQLMIPWAGWTWSETSRSMFSLYLRKEIHNESLEHSNKTFDLTGSTGSPTISLNLSHSEDFPSKRIETTFDLFKYEFIFNDFWLDYSRKGLLASADFKLYKGLGGEALIGMYQDDYKLPQFKTGTCKASNSTTSTTSGEDPGRVSCTRSDSGNMFKFTLYYERSTNLLFKASYLTVENSSNLKVYSESKTVMMGSVVWAFPGTKRVARMTYRFADAAFTKDSLQ
jgi:hypothetical protein